MKSIERQMKELTEWSKQNWLKIPELVREDCLNELETRTPKDMLALWVQQVREGREIGSDDIRFHFALGMQIRNALRNQLTDEELPAIQQRDGSYAKNWDDFYVGVLHEFVAREIARRDESSRAQVNRQGKR